MVMVVDDDQSHLRLVETVKRPLGFLVQTVPDAATALEILQDAAPDIFLLDIDMPGKDGWALASRIRALPTHRNTPILMVSGHALEARHPVEREGLYDAFIVKPYSVHDMLRRLADLPKVTLVHRQTDTEDDDPKQVPETVVERLRELASIGHAASLRLIEEFKNRAA
ncbi:response regulator [Thalassobius vesicularis]|uniref:Response regulator n=1 Tax=Thalassobius vesicularis TaxID=1294297 RepID=A0A4S3MD89_9RHOB|nr:response regulator [Thalassobius vesicularis]THD76572.1 response regulator [Thalassobius vesicularis]